MSSNESPHEDGLLIELYSELRKLASRKIAAEPAGLSLGATDLVHEAYLRIKNSSVSVAWDGRSHYFVAASEAMRRVLVDRARRRKTLKRGGGAPQPLAEDQAANLTTDPMDLIALDEALEKLDAVSPRHSALVKLRYFAGLTIDGAAEVLGVSPSTVDSDWAYARAWLQIAINGASTP